MGSDYSACKAVIAFIVTRTGVAWLWLFIP